MPMMSCTVGGVAASTSAGRTTASSTGKPRGLVPGPTPNRPSARLRTNWPDALALLPPRQFTSHCRGRLTVYRRQEGPGIDPRPHQEVHALAGAAADVLRGTRSLRCKGHSQRTRHWALRGLAQTLSGRYARWLAPFTVSEGPVGLYVRARARSHLALLTAGLGPRGKSSLRNASSRARPATAVA